MDVRSRASLLAMVMSAVSVAACVTTASGDFADWPVSLPRDYAASATSELPPVSRRPNPARGEASSGSPTPRKPSRSRIASSPASVPLRPLPKGAVPILYYHRVQSVPAGFADWSARRQRTFLRYDVLPAAFLAQLDWLRAHGYRTILPRDLAAHWAGRKRLPARPVILTFDDGFPSWTNVVLPALRSRGMVAEFYLTLDAIAPGSITWRDVRALALAGNGIGAHDVHHIQLTGVPGRAHASAAVMWTEVHDIRAVIKRHIGVAPDSMAYVGGGFDATLMALVRKAGYTTARSILRGIVQTKAHRYRLAVVRIGAHDDVVDPKTETLVEGLPTFTARVAGESDLRRR